jgi:hypothetical protein
MATKLYVYTNSVLLQAHSGASNVFSHKGDSRVYIKLLGVVPFLILFQQPIIMKYQYRVLNSTMMFDRHTRCVSFKTNTSAAKKAKEMYFLDLDSTINKRACKVKKKVVHM